MSTEVQKQLKILREGVVDLISEEELEERLTQSARTGTPLRIKYGADPSAPDLHLGHTVPLRKLKVFQDLGHTIVFIIGDFTARIGDPTQRSETRPMLTRQEVNRNAITYQEQVFRILDARKTEVRYNSEWLDRMKPEDFLKLTAEYTVARLLERDDFEKRYRTCQPIALVEFMYPLLQGYDSVKVESDIELGGTDQKFNLLVGRDLQKSAGQKPQMVMTLPLLEGTDGVQKMSKSYGNYIAIEDEPQDMYGKVMSIPDKLLTNYYRYASGLESPEVEKILRSLKNGSAHPRDVKAKLAQHIVSLYHTPEKAEAAAEEFDTIFRNKGLPDEIETLLLHMNQRDLVTVLKEAGMVSSKSEARRLVEQGGVKVDQVKITDPQYTVPEAGPVLIQCGKRKFAKIQFG